jgi:hypothetical protein
MFVHALTTRPLLLVFLIVDLDGLFSFHRTQSHSRSPLLFSLDYVLFTRLLLYDYDNTQSKTIILVGTT